MSSYFDDLNRLVGVVAKDFPNDPVGTEGFLKSVMQIEAKLKKDCELFAGDVETPEDVRQCIMACIALHEIRYKGGEFLGDEMGESAGARYAVVCRSSKLIHEMHSLWHDIARMRYQMRYGMVSDNPEWAVQRRDAFALENDGKPHPWQTSPPTAGDEPFRTQEFRMPKNRQS